MTVQSYLEFRSRVDNWMVGFMVGATVLGFLVCILVLLDSSLEPASRVVICLVMLLLILLLIWILLGTRYRLTETHLLTQSGPFRKMIKLDTIIMVEPVCHYQTGLALSRDRFLVRYNKYSKVEISPEDRGRFLKELADRAPQLIWQDEKLVVLY